MTSSSFFPTAGGVRIAKPGGVSASTILDIADVVPPSQSKFQETVTCGVGSTFRNVSGAAGNIFFVKTASPNTWTAIA